MPAGPGPEPLMGQISFQEILDQAASAPAPSDRVFYGSEPTQFGALWLPEWTDPDPRAPGTLLPVVMLIHGGCWLNTYDVDHVAPLANALQREGLVVWAPEYRRLGDPGGGNPGTFQDVLASWRALESLAARFGLDMDRVLLMGHSAGGHLALWLAQEPNVTVRGVLSLAGITDLLAYRAPTGCGASVDPLLGGSPDEVPDAFQRLAPVHRTPLGPTVPVVLVTAEQDGIVPEAQAQGYVARDAHARILSVPGGHFDLIAPWTPAWPLILSQVNTLLRSP